MVLGRCCSVGLQPSLGSIRLDHRDHLQDGSLNRLVNLCQGRGVAVRRGNLQSDHQSLVITGEPPSTGVGLDYTRRLRAPSCKVIVMIQPDGAETSLASLYRGQGVARIGRCFEVELLARSVDWNTQSSEKQPHQSRCECIWK